MKNEWSFITIFLIISVLLSVEVNARLIDMEDVNKTMVAVEILFDSNDSDKLEYVSSKIVNIRPTPSLIIFSAKL